MKTTIEVPDELYRRAKAEAALRGQKLKDIFEQGLRMVLDAPPKGNGSRSLSALTKRARGVVKSGIPDLGSNPAHLEGLGRRARNR